MSLLEYPAVLGAACLGGGALLGYWLLRWKERSVRDALAIKEQSILETARRQADAITREARLLADEEALRVRQQTETTFITRRHELDETEKRLLERETLINRQLQSLVEEEKLLRQQLNT